ncbi:MAG TPA: hypothetical protein VK168_20135 [Saprospiraceae bacterium]|nr:hypothetical protein [Saprospiraceae bacterium]
MNHVFQISLKSVFLLENGEALAPKGSTLLSVALVYPREGVNLIERLKTLPLNPKDGEKHKPLKTKEEYSLSNEPFEDRLLFKESIQGDSVIKITLSIVSSPDKVDELLKKLLKAGAIAAVGTLTGGIGVTITAAVAETVIESIFQETKKGKDANVFPLGTASLGINNDTEEGDIALHLVTTREIKYTLDRKVEDGQITEVIRKIPKGFGIAKVVLNIEKKEKEKQIPVVA